MRFSPRRVGRGASSSQMYDFLKVTVSGFDEAGAAPGSLPPTSGTPTLSDFVFFLKSPSGARKKRQLIRSRSFFIPGLWRKT